MARSVPALVTREPVVGFGPGAGDVAAFGLTGRGSEEEGAALGGGEEAFWCGRGRGPRMSLPRTAGMIFAVQARRRAWAAVIGGGCARDLADADRSALRSWSKVDGHGSRVVASPPWIGSRVGSRVSRSWQQASPSRRG